MDKHQIVALRQELSCTQRELAETLGLDAKIVQSWEAGELFPTKRLVQQLELLRQRGATAIVRKRRRGHSQPALDPLEDPRLWSLVRRLVEDPELLEKVLRMAEGPTARRQSSSR